MGLIPPNEKEFDVPEIDKNLLAVMEKILDEYLFTYSISGKSERQDTRRAFNMGWHAAKIGYLSRGIK